jgi:hypothetical protein
MWEMHPRPGEHHLHHRHRCLRRACCVSRNLYRPRDNTSHWGKRTPTEVQFSVKLINLSGVNTKSEKIFFLKPTLIYTVYAFWRIGTIRKCSSGAFQWKVISVGYDNLISVGQILCPALDERSHHQCWTPGPAKVWPRIVDWSFWRFLLFLRMCLNLEAHSYASHTHTQFGSACTRPTWGTL